MLLPRRALPSRGLRPSPPRRRSAVPQRRAANPHEQPRCSSCPFFLVLLSFGYWFASPPRRNPARGLPIPRCPGLGCGAQPSESALTCSQDQGKQQPLSMPLVYSLNTRCSCLSSRDFGAGYGRENFNSLISMIGVLLGHVLVFAHHCGKACCCKTAGTRPLSLLRMTGLSNMFRKMEMLQHSHSDGPEKSSRKLLC